MFTLVRKALNEEPRELQESEDDEDELLSGLLYIHAMRLADIFSDDSNFRNSVMDFIVCTKSYTFLWAILPTFCFVFDVQIFFPLLG